MYLVIIPNSLSCWGRKFETIKCRCDPNGFKYYSIKADIKSIFPLLMSVIKTVRDRFHNVKNLNCHFKDVINDIRMRKLLIVSLEAKGFNCCV